jgi:endonuclease YncB( thermonuclease family)
MRPWIKSYIILEFALSICTANAAEIAGVPHVVDGDTITIADVKIRLDGIDAPETDQVCLDRQAARWTCGIEARNQLSQHVDSRAIHCTPTGVDVYRRVLAVCRLDDEDLNAWMVRQGWALAFVRYSKTYVADEASARNAQRGMWAGAFIAPWDWRSRTPSDHRARCRLRSCQGPSFAPRACIRVRSAVPGVHHQGQRESQGRANLSPPRGCFLCPGQYECRWKALVLHGE